MHWGGGLSLGAAVLSGTYAIVNNENSKLEGRFDQKFEKIDQRFDKLEFRMEYKFDQLMILWATGAKPVSKTT